MLVPWQPRLWDLCTEVGAPAAYWVRPAALPTPLPSPPCRTSVAVDFVMHGECRSRNALAQCQVLVLPQLRLTAFSTNGYARNICLTPVVLSVVSLK
jgi:hypothetical protein